jgi:hypothetical protein
VVARRVRIALWCACVSFAGTASSAVNPPAASTGIWMQAITQSFVIIDMSGGDIDGDGKDELAICYREQPHGSGGQKGGVILFADSTGNSKPLFHSQLDEAPCEKVAVQGRQLVLQLPGKKQLTWTYGAEIRFRSDASSPFAGMAVKASSQADAAHAGKAAIDGDLNTSWGEGAPGTGIGQTLLLTLPKPMFVGVVGVVCGDVSGTRPFFDNNRVHRGSIEAKTGDDLGDTAAGVDFASLGIATIGDRVEFTCENRPGVTYVNVNRRDVREIELRVDSVYLGDKKDETRVAEVEIVPVLLQSETYDRSKDLTKPPPRADKPTTPVDDRANEAVKKLDESGRILVPSEP